MALKDRCVSITAKERRLERPNSRTMDPMPMLLKVSQLIQVILALSEKAFYYKKDCQTLAAYITDLKPLFEELKEDNSVLVGINLYALECIEKIFLKARDLLKKCAGQTSKSFMIVQKVQTLKKFHDISVELKSCLGCLPLKSLRLSNCTQDQVQQCIKNLPETEYYVDVLEEQISEELGSALKLLQKGVNLNCAVLVKLADKLNLKSNQEILMEVAYLEKEKGNCVLSQDKQSKEVIDTLIILFTEMADHLAEQSQVVIGGISIPADFRCPLSLELMSDPVIVSSGQTYERGYIQKWIDQGITTCPKTRQVLRHLNLIPNYTVKALIRHWCESNKVPLPGPAKIETLAMDIPPSSKCNIGNHENLHHKSPRMYSDHAYMDRIGAGSAVGATIGNRPSVRSVRTRLYQGTGATRREARSPVGSLEEGRDYLQSNSRAVSVVDASATCSREAELMDGSQNHCRNASTSSIRFNLDDSPMANAIEDNMQQSLSLYDSSPYVSDVSGELGTSPSTVAASTEDSSCHSKRFDWNSESLKRGAADNNIQNAGSISSSSRSIQTDAANTIQLRVKALMNDLHSSEDQQRNAAIELRLLAKFNMENRIIIANCGAIPALVDLLMSTDLHIQENAVTSLLNLSINDNNKSEIAAAGAIDPLVHVLNVGTTEAKENAAATLYSLSVLGENKVSIGQSGAIASLVDLLIQGTPRGKKDAATALFSLSIFHENKARIVRANAIRPLVKLMSDPAAGMVDKAVTVLANLASIEEGRRSIGEEGGIPALVEALELGSQRGKENAAAALLHLCTNSNRFKAKVLQEGAIPPLVALTKSGTSRAKEKASSLLRLFKEQRHTGLGRGGAEPHADRRV